MMTTNRRQLLSGTGLVMAAGAVPGMAGAQAPAAGRPDLFIGTGRVI